MPVRCSPKLKLFSQPPSKLVQNKPHERFGPVNITRGDNKIQRNRMFAVHQVMNTKIRKSCVICNYRVTIEPKKTHGGGNHSGKLIFGFVHHLPGTSRNNRVGGLTKMGIGEHVVQGRINAMAGVGKKVCNTRKALVLFGIEDMENNANKQGVPGLFPMVMPLFGAVRINKDIRHVLHVTNLILPFPDLQKRIEPHRVRRRRLKPPAPRKLLSPART